MAFQYAEAQRKVGYPPVAATPKAKPIPRPTIPMAASQTQKPLGSIPQRTPTMLGGATNSVLDLTKPQAGPTPLPYSPAGPQGMAAASKYATPPVYGANIIGKVDTNPESQIAALGQEWASAPKEQRAGIHDRAQAIGTAAGGSYDAKTGKWTFSPQIVGQTDDNAAGFAAATPAAFTPPTFTAPTPTQQIPTATPAIPVMNEAAIKEYTASQIAAKLAKLRQSADQSIAAGRTTADRQLQGLQTGFDRQRANITEDRNVANTAFDRTYSPFSGGTEEKRFQRDFGRERTDREMNADNLSRQANVQQDAANLEQTINEKYAMMQQLAPEEQAAMEQSIRNDERQYELMLRGELRSDTMANSQLNDTQFNQSLAGYNARRTAFEDERNFDYGKYSDQVNWTGNLGGQRTLAGQAQDFNQGEQQWRDKFDFGQATGQFANGQKTLQSRMADIDNLWKVAEATGTIPDEIGKMYGLPKGTRTMDAQKFGLDKQRIQADISNMQADNARQGAGGGGSGGSGGNPKPANMNTIIDNINTRYLRSKTDIGAGATYNQGAVEKYILSLHLSPEETDQLYAYYGIPNVE